MNLGIRLLFISWLFINISFSQDFNSFNELKQLLQVDLMLLEDSLIKKGFVFEKTEGLVFKYKKPSGKIEFQTTPRELAYQFTDRSFFLRVNSELASENYQLINDEENITVNNKGVKAAYLKKDEISIYLWSSMDEATKKTMYAIKIKHNLIVKNIIPPSDSMINPTVQKQESESPKFQELLQQKIKKQKVTTSVARDSVLFYPNPFRFSFTLAGFRFVDPDYGPGLWPNLQVGFNKSTYLKKIRSNKWVSDIGNELDFSFFTGMDYGWRSNKNDPYSSFEEYISLNKFYLSCNQYISYNLKFIDFVIEGGPFLNYNHGKGIADSAGFLTSGFHFGEQIQRGIGSSKNGGSKLLIAIGFDQYIAFKGGYIGSFGITVSY